MVNNYRLFWKKKKKEKSGKMGENYRRRRGKDMEGRYPQILYTFDRRIIKTHDHSYKNLNGNGLKKILPITCKKKFLI